MAYSPIPALDDLSVREWNNLTDDLAKTIGFCQRVGLLHTYPAEFCPKKHSNWYLGSCPKSIDKCKWRCRVYRRGAATLLPLIHQFILPGSTNYSDQCSAYNSIVNINNGPNRYAHETVNHSINFVDPTTLVHTQTVENVWMVAKIRKKNQMGQHRSLLDSHLAEFIWRRKFGNRSFENLIRIIQEVYPAV
ncbi:unnamed protein product [Adineta ricciae]|uniref:ISXO2-like transposase domain-containing protein n=1 Tax=Adineta ricciae TaxID=249248 RepID=A0A815QFE7_ADIRI|nr:unnamed protein product [Adineta ricciae]CAF1462570.1 unnamed protein product [Adineta ricciae]